ncbi:putative lipoprotein [Leadbettera azotonutricia ZAS-9]|uniref:Putative lipoprotein n=1 Tax=Leadbettera azotonutricia (strain ATCC BAA-888 / DSM 13862 / ZAS-9) TaxID=545695 RepID=F5Y7B9_LEAAZ|nr:nucleotidyltransferase domain-containing protein [Leadbettera azotonutricia]AEF80358.1 putative lipoprotein [Leadbettera azotonutricia ZAS-9]
MGGNRQLWQGISLIACSYAYGIAHKDSDLDLMVVLKDDAAIRDMDAIIKIRYAIDEKKSMPVDIVVSRHSAFGR